MIPREDTIELLRRLVSIPSVNPNLDPSGAGEADIAAFAVRWLRERGVEASIENAAEGRPNAVASIGPEGPALVLCAHLDTVSAERMTIPPFEPTLDGNRLYGRGSYDMKGGAASAMAAAVALSRMPLSGRVLLALVADEEFRSAGADDFVRRHGADACIVTEPSELQLVLAHKGFGWFEIATSGRAAHGSRWDLGESAVGKMGPIIAALERFDREILRGRDHELTGPASLHCAVVDGGSGWSTYAERCTLQVERRTIPGEPPDDVFDEIRSVVAKVNPDADVRLVFERLPSSCEPDARIAECVRDAAAGLRGHAPEEIGVAYWMDAAIFSEAGIPTVNIGPSGEGAHAAVEWVDVDSVVSCAEILVDAARRFLS